jgi:hypothetical protein
MMRPDDLLGSAVVDAAVEALVIRNREHVERLTGAEREAAIADYRSVVLDVLAAARAAVGGPDRPEPRGRAVIVLEDDGGSSVDVHAAFHPELDDVPGEDAFAGTAAQAAAVQLLRALAG